MKQNYSQYKSYGYDFIERAFMNDSTQSIADVARNLSGEIEIEYTDSFRRQVSEWINQLKEKKANQSDVKQEKFSFDGFELNIPDGEDEIELPELALPKRYKSIGVLSDIHFPYHDRSALTRALKGIKDFEVDAIYLNGDTIDAYQLSRHEKNKLNRSFKYEVDMTKLFFSELRSQFPDIDIYYKVGNHDSRFNKYINENAEQLQGIIGFEDVMKLRDYRIKYVPSETKAIFGKLNILHGHELPVKGATNHARTIMLKVMSNVLVGHFHRTDHSSIRDLDGSVYAVFATGCLCKLNPKYMPINNWNHGYAIIEKDREGNFEVHNRQLF